MQTVLLARHITYLALPVDGLTVAGSICCSSSYLKLYTAPLLLPQSTVHVEWSIEINPLVTRQVITLPVSHDMVLLSLDCTLYRYTLGVSFRQ